MDIRNKLKKVFLLGLHNVNGKSHYCEHYEMCVLFEMFYPLTRVSCPCPHLLL